MRTIIRFCAFILVATTLGLIVNTPASTGKTSTRSVPQPKQKTDIVGFVLENRGEPVRERDITFGQIFEPGQIPSNVGALAYVAGQPIPTQMDVKASNPDGSVRMAIVTVRPHVLKSGRTAVMLTRGHQASLPDLDLHTLKDYPLTIDISPHRGAAHHLNVASLLASALSSGSASYWLRGPLTTEARVNVPLEGSLHLTLDIRQYSDSTTVTDIAFKNDYSFEREGGAVTYDVVIRLANAVALNRDGVVQPEYTHWHFRVWTKAIPNVNVIHDIAALERSGAILDYDLNTPIDPAVVQTEANSIKGPSFDILGNAGITMYMPTAGGRGDIGPTTQANAIWLITQDSRAGTFALAQADAAGSIPWHYFDRKLDNYRTTTEFPTLWEDPRGGSFGTTGLTQPLPYYSQTCQCWEPDTAHQPDLAFIPYIFTGTRYYLDQIEAQSAWDILVWNPHYRMGGLGIVVFPDNEVRGKAWDLRGIMNAAWIVPDHDPLKSYFEKIESNNFEYLTREIGILHQGRAAGWILGVYGDNNGAVAPWQQDYFASIIALGAKRGVPHAIEILKWETNFLAGRFLAQAEGFPPYDGAAYNLYLWEPPSILTGAYRSWAKIEEVSRAHGQSGGGNKWPDGTFVPYLQAARCVLAEIISLTNSSSARQAYGWVVEHSPQATTRLSTDPTWSVIPTRPN